MLPGEVKVAKLPVELPTSTMSWCTELPAELTCRPLGVVSLVGLDVVNSPVHRTIWDSFAINRQPQRVPLVFKNLPFSHQYPKAKPNRTSYDWYVPKGILKTNWMQKHLQSVPAVVVIFYDIEWDDPQWTERCNDLAAKVDLVRSSLQGRATKIGLVLVQKNAGLPGDQDLDQQQKAHMLCNRCGNIAAKSLFVLPYTEHLPGYVMRLENAFYEMSQNYYYSEGRRIKSYRELLNKTTHQLLFVRHQFKAAFFNELKQDPTSALRHYKQAYEHIKELRMYDSHMLEIKTIAGFVNYKICRISFQQSTPRDAIAQFRQHVDLFKHKIGIKDLAFEHSAWMAKQFCIFGELFSEAIGAGLTALITQHPGFYFQQAANYTAQRRRQCRLLCHSSSEGPSGGTASTTSSAAGDPLDSLDKLDYYGQRPWRQGHQSIDPPEPAREREGVQALQRKEADVQHCFIIIPLLSSAVSQFKRYKSPRMKRYLIVQMGEEYYQAKEYAKALEHVSHVTWEYRNERWATLLHAILKITWRCAFLVGNVSAFVSASLELISDNIPDSLLSVEEKSKIQSNLMRVLFLAAGNGCPEDSDLVSSVGAFTAEELESRWQRPASTLDPFSNTFNIDATSLASFVRVKAHFSASSFSADGLVEVDVCVVVSSPSPIEFSKLRISLSDSDYDDCCVLEGGAADVNSSNEDHEGASSSLFFEPGVVKAFRFHFAPRSSDVGASLRIVSISLHLGDPKRRSAVLTWNEGGGDVMSIAGSMAATSQAASTSGATDEAAAGLGDNAGGGSHSFWQRPPPRRKPTPEEEWRFIPRGPTTTKIEARKPRVALKVTHAPPCLVNEFYVVDVAVNNEEDVMVTDVTISVELISSGAVPTTSADGQQQQPTTLEDSTQLFLEIPTTSTVNPSAAPRVAEVPLPDLDAGQSCVKTFYLRVTQPGERRFAVMVNYAVEAGVEKPQTPAAPLHSSSNVEPMVVNAGGGLSSSSSSALLGGETRRRCLCLSSTEFSMQSMRPFQIITKPLTAKLEATEVVFDQEPFLLTCDIKCISEWPIQIKTSVLERSENMLLPNGETNLASMLDDLTLQSHDICRDLYCLVPSIGARSQQLQQQLGTAANLQIGHYTLEWRRTSVDGSDPVDLPFVKSTMPLPLVPCQSLPLSVDLKLPAYGTMRSPMSVRYRLENKTMLPQDLEIVIESSEGFMFSGQKQMTMRLLPFDHQDLLYNLFPLVAGNVTLPRLNVSMTRYPNLAIAEIVHKLIPSQIFVIPAKKDGGLASLSVDAKPTLIDAPLTDVAS